MGKKKDVVAQVTETKSEKKPTLLWNEAGKVGCTLKGHAPRKGSDTWKLEGWSTLSDDKDAGTPFVCETCKAGATTTEIVPPIEAEPAPTPKKKSKKDDATLADLAEKYLAHMDRASKSSGTILSYRLELLTAMHELGGDTKLADLTPEKVALYFGCARVNKKKNGKVKSPLSIAKSQRVLRLALVWAEGAKLIAKAPLPEDLATH